MYRANELSNKIGNLTGDKVSFSSGSYRVKCPSFACNGKSGQSLSITDSDKEHYHPKIYCHRCNDFNGIKDILDSKIPEWRNKKTNPDIEKKYKEDIDKENKENIEKKKKKWQSLTGTLQEIKGTPAEKYLKSRGLFIDNEFMPTRLFWNSKERCMVASITQFQEDKANGISYIHLDDSGLVLKNIDGKKLRFSRINPKNEKLTGNGFWAYDNKETKFENVVIVEGVEDSLLTYHYLSRFSIKNIAVVASLGASNFDKIVLPKNIKNLYIWADNDKAGLKACENAKLSYKRENLNIFTICTETDPADFCKENIEKGTAVNVLSQALPVDSYDIFENKYSVFDSNNVLDSPPPPQKWLIQNFLPAGQVGLFVGSGGVGKSYILLSLALGIASGRLPFKLPSQRKGLPLIPQPPKTDCPVLCIFSEDDKDEIARRLHKIKKTEYQNDECGNIKILSRGDFVEPFFNVMVGVNSEILNDLLAYVAKTKPKLIILDSISRFFHGDENDNVCASQFITILERLKNAADNDCTLIAIHHSTKTANESSGRVRGASAFRDNSRFVISARKLANIGLPAKFVSVEIDKANSFQGDSWNMILSDCLMGGEMLKLFSEEDLNKYINATQSTDISKIKTALFKKVQAVNEMESIYHSARTGGSLVYAETD